LEEDGLYARFVLSEDEEYWIEPLESRLKGAAPGQYVVYHTADIIPSGGSCGADALTHPLPPEGGERGGSREACGGGFPCLAELACDADYPYFLNYGSVSAVENRINLVINQVNIQYERDVEIIHEITAIIVRASSAADPYTTNDPEGLLNQFRDHWEANHGNIQRDLAQLFTGRNLSGTTIGIAWLDAVCTDWAYSVVESDCCGTLACAADLSAHEMGHNWGAEHCTCPGWTMNYTMTNCSRQFTSGSIFQIVSYRDSIQFCLEAGGDMVPDPMTFLIPPSGASTSSVIMVATEVQGGAPPPIEYFFDFVSGGSGGNDSGWQLEPLRSYIDSGLETNTPYTYRVKARDSGSPPNQTAYSANAQTATRIEEPTGLVIGTVTTDSIELSASGTFTNLTVGSSGIYFDSTTSGGDGGINEWLQITTDTATGLSPDAMYEFQVRARNQISVMTPYSGTASKATLANVPGAPILTVLDCSSLDIDIDANGNPAITTYAVLCSDTSPHDATWDGQYVDATGDPSASPVYQTAADWDTTAAIGLTEQYSYTFEANARNQEGVETTAGPSATQATPACSMYGDGDFDFDGDRDIFDFAAFQQCFGQLVGPGCEPGNMAGDDMIGLDDFAEFYNSLSGPS
jgi:hypothetical protein